ncbi:hypothetical protein [Hoylesella marshii]|jgi:hypothetical protein|uniref:CD-NTase-associated protein 12/Pycsar effector protein TIR domain-containing protein n=1 Tax=Hoylesella marshii DSM 16973 = JCM 13450 TaxID=862515 RepID=E0NVQ5_9BACT|nr:hypothetical protein [Hoylesella marshii]EFM00781.1 hypothetical protein HMPREF0658_2260 [Hoylesella marshii DSM 16973 = JCM 13450]
MGRFNRYCFVIQPIRDEEFTKRYSEVFKPAIEAANLSAYRIDLDPEVKNIIDGIEKKIADAALCLVDISIDNPNVWYELGYAYAKNKDIVMICEESRRMSFPFDVSHKSIIKYKTGSPSDFNDLETKITEKINAYLKGQKSIQKIIESPLKNNEGFQPYETSLLALIVGEQLTDKQSVSIYKLQDEMIKLGFNKVAVSIGVRLLQKKLLIETLIASTWDGEEYEACKLTAEGVNFILSHTDLFDLSPAKYEASKKASSFNDLPF